MIKITSDLLENMHLKGHFYISENGVVNIYGTITGTLNLLQHSRVNLFGTVNGNVNNHGGILKILGTVIGKIVTVSGSTLIAKTGRIYSVDDLII